jgi:uncharacterized protein YheU (UPF0270 family)
MPGMHDVKDLSDSQNERQFSLAPVKVPVEALSADTLRSVLESYILREGTDYGTDELNLETKVANLMRRIAAGAAHLVFDPNTETITFVTDAEWRRASAKFDEPKF